MRERVLWRSDGGEPKRIGCRAPSQRRSSENERGSDTKRLGGAVGRHLKWEGGVTSANKWGVREKQCDKVREERRTAGGAGGKALQRCGDVAEEVGRQVRIASFIQSKTQMRDFSFFYLHRSFSYTTLEFVWSLTSLLGRVKKKNPFCYSFLTIYQSVVLLQLWAHSFGSVSVKSLSQPFVM